MAISYPLTLPDTSFKRVTIRANTTVAQLTSQFTGKTQVYNFPGKRWIAEVTFPIMTRADAAYWSAFLLKLNGPFGTFMLGDPAAATPQGSALGSPKVNGNNQEGQSLLTKGWQSNINNVLRAMDYIQIGQNLYATLNDVNSDGSGNATLDVWPPLRSPTIDNTTIITSSCKGLFQIMQTDYPIYSVDTDKTYEIFFTAVEVVV